MGAENSAVNSYLRKLCTCGSENDSIDSSNMQKIRKTRNMSPKPLFNDDMLNINSVFEYEASPDGIPMDSSTINLLANMEDIESISPQNLLRSSTAPLDMSDINPVTNEHLEGTQRIQKISVTADVIELKKMINQNYDPSQSSPTPPLKEANLQATKPNIYRDGTNTPWDADHMEELTYEMHDQLILLNSIHGDVDDDNTLGDAKQIDDCLSDDEDLPSSNLYRDASKQKWTCKDMDLARRQMKKQILHLALRQSKSSERIKNHSQMSGD